LGYVAGRREAYCEIFLFSTLDFKNNSFVQTSSGFRENDTNLSEWEKK
jgi:hypothetical protein